MNIKWTRETDRTVYPNEPLPYYGELPDGMPGDGAPGAGRFITIRKLDSVFAIGGGWQVGSGLYADKDDNVPGLSGAYGFRTIRDAKAHCEQFVRTQLVLAKVAELISPQTRDILNVFLRHYEGAPIEFRHTATLPRTISTVYNGTNGSSQTLTIIVTHTDESIVKTLQDIR